MAIRKIKLVAIYILIYIVYFHVSVEFLGLKSLK
jgi:hypothetical protein